MTSALTFADARNNHLATGPSPSPTPPDIVKEIIGTPSIATSDSQVAPSSSGPSSPPSLSRTPLPSPSLPLSETVITYGGKEFALLPVAHTSNKTTYKILGDRPLIDRCSNNTLFVKAVPEILDTRNREAVNSQFALSLTQHKELVESGFPLPRIANIDTAEKDGFVVVERVSILNPRALWGRTVTLSALSAEQREDLRMLCDLFGRSFRLPAKMRLDLLGNIGITSEGRLVMHELKCQTTDPDSDFQLRELHWASAGIPEIYQHLVTATLSTEK